MNRLIGWVIEGVGVALLIVLIAEVLRPLLPVLLVVGFLAVVVRLLHGPP